MYKRRVATISSERIFMSRVSNRAAYCLMGILAISVEEAKHLLQAVEAAQIQNLIETGKLKIGTIINLSIGLGSDDRLFIKKKKSSAIDSLLDIGNTRLSDYAYLEVSHINKLKSLKEKLRDKISEDPGGELQDD